MPFLLMMMMTDKTIIIHERLNSPAEGQDSLHDAVKRITRVKEEKEENQEKHSRDKRK